MYSPYSFTFSVAHVSIITGGFLVEIFLSLSLGFTSECFLLLAAIEHYNLWLSGGGASVVRWRRQATFQKRSGRCSRQRADEGVGV